MSFLLAFKNIFRNKARSLITLAALATGCVAIIIAGGFIEDSIHLGREGYIRQFLGHIQISQRGYSQKGTSSPFTYMISPSADVINELRQLPHVIRLSPRL